MPELADFQDAFAAALAGGDLQGWIAGDASGLAVYRNTSLKGAIDALQANFPAVAAMVGDEWFRAAAREYVLAYPPERPALNAYGADFPDWLAAFPPAAALPYLPAAARLDRLWLEALFAAEAPTLDAHALTRLDAEALERTAVRLHPSVRLAWLDDNSPTLWRETRWPSDPGIELEHLPEPQGIVLSRAQDTVQARLVGDAESAFLAACRAGRPLAKAALAADAAAELPAILAAALADGLFTALETLP